MTHAFVSNLFILNWRNFFCYLEFSGFPPIKSQLMFQFSIIHSHVRLHKPFFTIKDINSCHLQKKKKLTYRIEINFSFFFLFAERFKYWFQEQEKVYFFCLSKWRRKRTIYYSSFYWLVTPELARPVFCSDSVMTPLTPLLFLPLALTSKSRQLNWEERKSNCKFGTQPVKNVSTQLLLPITGTEIKNHCHRFFTWIW